MSLFQGIILLFVGLLVLVGLYIGFRWGSYKLNKVWPTPVQEVPTKVSTTPPADWWDALQGLRMHVDTQVAQMRGDAAAAAQAYRNAKSSEERLRRRRPTPPPQPELEWGEEEEEETAARQVTTIPDGWEPADTAPARPTPPPPNGNDRFALMMRQRRGLS